MPSIRTDPSLHVHISFNKLLNRGELFKAATGSGIWLGLEELNRVRLKCSQWSSARVYQVNESLVAGAQHFSQPLEELSQVPIFLQDPCLFWVPSRVCQEKILYRGWIIYLSKSWGPLHTRAKSLWPWNCEPKRKVSKGRRPNTSPTSCSVVTDLQV